MVDNLFTQHKTDSTKYVVNIQLQRCFSSLFLYFMNTLSLGESENKNFSIQQYSGPNSKHLLFYASLQINFSEKLATFFLSC